MNKQATISECGKYRYSLTRIWEEDGPRVLFIMLNPSTADDKIDDPTIRRCIGFAKSWGYGGLYVCNLFALRATNPKELYQSSYPYGNRNGYFIHKMAVFKSDKNVVCAWGGHGKFRSAGNQMINILRSYRITPKCFGTTKSGQPKHPLYLKKTKN